MATTGPPEPGGGIDDILERILDELAKLPGIVGDLADAVRQLSAGIGPLVTALANLVGAAANFTAAETLSERAKARPVAPPAQPPADGLGGGATRVVVSMDRAATAVNRLSALFERMFTTALTRAAGPLALPAANSLARPEATLAPPGPPAVRVLSVRSNAAPQPDGGGAAPGAAAGLGGTLARIAAAGAVAAAALGALVVAVNVAEQQFRQLEGLVRLFNPGVIDVFHQALNNLGATIGQAFVPVFQAATDVVRQWAAALAPVVSALAPAMRQFADAMGNALVSAAVQLANVFRSLLPLFRVFLDAWGLVAQVALNVFNVFAQVVRVVAVLTRVFLELTGVGLAVRVLTRVLEALSGTMRVFDEAITIVEAAVGALVDGLVAMVAAVLPVEDVMAKLRDAIQYVIREMYVFAVLLAKLVGLNEVVDALVASVEARTRTGATAAQQPQIKSLEQLSKDLALAAAAAGGAAGQGGVRNQQEFWVKTLEEMRAAQRNGVSIRDLLVDIKKAVERLNPFSSASTPPAPVPAGGRAGVGGLMRAATDVVRDAAIAGAAFGPVPPFIGGIIGAR